MGTKVRVLCQITVAGVGYKPDQVVDLPSAVAKSLAAEGQVDPHKEAVAYCIRDLGAEVIVHADPAEVVAASATKAAAISDIEQKPAVASDADKPALEADLLKLKAE